MFRDKTLFVVGAGASAEFELPVGIELAELVSKALTFKFDSFGRFEAGDADLYDRMRRSCDNEESRKKYRLASRQIASGIRLARSVDNYIDAHRDEAISFCAKLAITRCILQAERRSRLFYDTSNIYNKLDLARVDKTWIIAFSEILFDRVPKVRVEHVFDDISIICFNYDRCIEYFMRIALMSHYSLDERTALEILQKLKIYHPYGTVGALPPESGAAIAYGSEDTYHLANLAGGIKTYTEQVEGETQIHAIKQEMSKAQTIVFLGFGFLSQNMELLKPYQLVEKRVFGTARGISDFDLPDLRREVASLFLLPRKSPLGNDLQTIELRNDKGCVELFAEYQRSISRR